ncbi:hypothetical protein EDD29_0057 [Actinocorallia herbida]|uniref:Uncharacterized protein n=1 Tax=Actinocorallia herbida TaxID=58109 RepID=A0A3N1CMN1_9ACTN|nr:hypothetical protein [Actinocorallia herbida]ROO82577.1 hypothetical protein EDD29_0057 [Actinocorallia herbida]
MADLLADGNVKAIWVPAIADISAPTVAELTGGSAVDLSCLITADGLGIEGETAAVDNAALCSVADTEDAGRIKRDINITAKRKDSPAEDLAWETLTYRAEGHLVVRRNLPVATAWAAAQPVEVYPARCGDPIMAAPERNSVQKFAVKLFNHIPADTRAVVAA